MKMKTVQVYDLILMNGQVVHAREDFDLTGPRAFVDLYESAEDDDIFCITNLLTGSWYIPKKNILFFATGDVEEDGEFEDFISNVRLLRSKKHGSKN